MLRTCGDEAIVTKKPNSRLPFRFQARSQNCKKPLLASSCLPVRPSAWNNSAHTGWMFMKFDISVFIENLQDSGHAPYTKAVMDLL
jgi:hypothetical protein